MEQIEIEYLNAYIKWEAYYAPKFKKMFGIEMPTDTYGINILEIPEDLKIDIMVNNIYGEEGLNLLYEIIENGPDKFYGKL